MDSTSSKSNGMNGGGAGPSAKSRLEEALGILRAADYRERLVLVPPDNDATPKESPGSGSTKGAGGPTDPPQSKAAQAKAEERMRDAAKHLQQINFVTTDDPTLRQLIRDVGDAITATPGADPAVAASVAAAINALLGNERLQKLVLILMDKSGNQPDEAAPGGDTALLELLAAIANDPELRRACAFVAADGALRELCIALGSYPKLTKAFARTMSDPKAREFFKLMWAADTATHQNLIAALNRPEVLRLVVTACAKKQTETVIRTALAHPEAVALGTRVLGLRGLSRLIVDAAMKWSAAGPR